MTPREKILLERYRLGELPESLKAEVEQIQDFTTAMKELDASDKEIRDKFHFSSVEKRIRRKKAQNLSRFVTLAAGLVLFLGAGFFFNQMSHGTSSDYRIKGNLEQDPELTLYRMIDNSIEGLEDGSTASAGDLIQIGYKNIAESSFGLIMSMDGAGNQTLHYPLSGEDAVKLEEGGESFLPWSYELDNAPEYEAFFLILSDKPFTLRDISAVALLENRIPRNVEVYGLILNKR